MLPGVALSDWFRRMFSSSPGAEGAEDDAIEAVEYGAGPDTEPAPGFVAGGLTGQGGLSGLEAAEAADDAIHATDPPEDPAP